MVRCAADGCSAEATVGCLGCSAEKYCTDTCRIKSLDAHRPRCETIDMKDKGPDVENLPKYRNLEDSAHTLYLRQKKTIHDRIKSGLDIRDCLFVVDVKDEDAFAKDRFAKYDLSLFDPHGTVGQKFIAMITARRDDEILIAWHDTVYGFSPSFYHRLDLRIKRRLLHGSRAVGYLGTCFLVLFIGFGPAQNLVTTLFPTVGYASLFLIYLLYGISCLFAPFVISSVGIRTSLVIGACTYGIFIATLWIPSAAPLLVASGVNGIGAGFLWVAQATFVNNVVTRVVDKANNGKLTGLFFSAYSVSGMLGNLLSGAVLSTSNATVLIALLLACAFLAAIMLGFVSSLGLEASALEKQESEGVSQCWKFRQSLRAVFSCLRDRTMQLLLLYTLAQGLNSSFSSGLFPAMVGGGHGLQLVPRVFFVYAIARAIGSYVWGVAMDKGGWTPLCVAYFVIQVGVFVLVWLTQLYWSATIGLYYVIGLMLGCADGCVQVLQQVSVQHLFKDSNNFASAAACNRLASAVSVALGMLINFASGGSWRIFTCVSFTATVVGSVAFVRLHRVQPPPPPALAIVVV